MATRRFEEIIPQVFRFLNYRTAPILFIKRAEQKVLQNKQPLVNRSKKQNMTVFFHLEGHEICEQCNAADHLYQNIHSLISPRDLLSLPS